MLHSILRTAYPEHATGPDRAVRTFLMLVGLAVVGTLAATAWDWVLAEPTARRDAQIQEKLEQEIARQSPTPPVEPTPEPTPDDPSEPTPEPFDPGLWHRVDQVNIEPVTPSIMLLDDLTAEEVDFYSDASLEDPELFEHLTSLHERGTVADHTFSAQETGLSYRWTLDLNSSSATAIAMTDVQLSGLECVPATASAAFLLPNQGEADRNVLSFSMERPTVARLYEMEESGQAPGWGEPYFEQKSVYLGGPEEGVGFVVEVVTTYEDCTWDAFEVAWAGAESEGVYDVTNDDGSPFTARGVSPDADTFFVYPIDDGPDIYSDPLW